MPNKGNTRKGIDIRYSKRSNQLDIAYKLIADDINAASRISAKYSLLIMYLLLSTLDSINVITLRVQVNK